MKRSLTFFRRLVSAIFLFLTVLVVLGLTTSQPPHSINGATNGQLLLVRGQLQAAGPQIARLSGPAKSEPFFVLNCQTTDKPREHLILGRKKVTAKGTPVLIATYNFPLPSWDGIELNTSTLFLVLVAFSATVLYLAWRTVAAAVLTVIGATAGAGMANHFPHLANSPHMLHQATAVAAGIALTLILAKARI